MATPGASLGKLFLVILACLGSIQKLLSTEISVHTLREIFVLTFKAIGPYALNIRANISQYVPRARLIRAYWKMMIICCELRPVTCFRATK